MDPFNLQEWPGFKRSGGTAAALAVVDQIVIDSRRISSQNALFAALPGGSTDGHKFIEAACKAGAKFALVGKNWKPLKEISGIVFLRVDCPLQALQEIASCYRRKLKCKVFAIGGSYGKTMVKDLLHTLLANSYSTASSPESFNSQIGVPLSLFTLSQKHEMAILEAGISEKGEMQKLAGMIQPDYGLITHFGKKHLATLGSLELGAQEMIQLFKGERPPNWVFLPQNPLMDALKVPSPIHFWNAHEEGFPIAEMLEAEQDFAVRYRVLFPGGAPYLGKIAAGFSYFLDLINMTVKPAWRLGVSEKAIAESLENYIAEPMRKEIWRSAQSVTFINDCYSSDPQSIDQSLKLMQGTAGKGKKFFIFGGLRGNENPEDYLRVAKSLNTAKLDLLCLYGKHPFEPLESEIKQSAPHTEILKAETCAESLELLKPLIGANDTVLIKGARKEPFEKILHSYHESILTNLCVINLAAIESNIKAIRQKLPLGTRIMVMVKALAYGTDDLRIAKFLKTCGIDILGVSYVDEALSLIRGGVKQSIFVLNAAPYEASKVVNWDLEVGVSDLNFIQVLAKCAKDAKKVIKVHLHVDTGMCRFGCRPESALELAKAIEMHPCLKLEGIMTHFASADNKEEDAFTLMQAAKLDLAISELKMHGIIPAYSHAANSGASLRFRFPQYNMVRLGLAVYGLYPSKDVQESLDLRLAISLLSRIVGINLCKKGETISYGRTYKAEGALQKIAVLPIGYFDGLHRNYSGKGYVLIRGQKASMVGKICMDFMMVDVTDIPHVSIGDTALIFGEDEYGHFLSPEDLAGRGDSIIHELITCLGPRIQRIFVFEESNQQR